MVLIGINLLVWLIMKYIYIYDIFYGWLSFWNVNDILVNFLIYYICIGNFITSNKESAGDYLGFNIRYLSSLFLIISLYIDFCDLFFTFNEIFLVMIMILALLLTLHSFFHWIHLLWWYHFCYFSLLNFAQNRYISKILFDLYSYFNKKNAYA